MIFRAAVIVVNWNSGPLLARCLAAVQAQTLPPSEVLVVDNDSQDGSADAQGNGQRRGTQLLLHMRRDAH